MLRRLAIDEIHQLDPSLAFVEVHQLGIDVAAVRLKHVGHRRIRFHQERPPIRHAHIVDECNG